MGAVLDELLKHGITTRSEAELRTLASYSTPSWPGPPLIRVSAKDLAPGMVLRVWHDILNKWATGWLEVLFIADDRIGMRIRLAAAPFGTSPIRQMRPGAIRTSVPFRKRRLPTHPAVLQQVHRRRPRQRQEQ